MNLPSELGTRCNLLPVRRLAERCHRILRKHVGLTVNHIKQVRS